MYYKSQILNFSCWFSPPISRSFLEIKEYIRMYRADEQELFLEEVLIPLHSLIWFKT